VTYSILGYERANGDLGVAVQSKFPGVRSLVPYGEAGIGVVATQAFGNPRHGTIGLQLLRCGATPHQAVDVLLHSDGHRTKRQFALLDSSGEAAAYSGDDLHDWDGWPGGAHGAVPDSDHPLLGRGGGIGASLLLPAMQSLIHGNFEGAVAAGHDRGRVATAALPDRQLATELADTYSAARRHPRKSSYSSYATRLSYSAEPTRGLASTGPTGPCSPP
jgi:hypothetical protein